MSKTIDFLLKNKLSSPLLILLGLLLSLQANGQNSCFEIRFSSQNAQPGDTIEVQVSVRGFIQISSYQMAAAWAPADLKFIRYSSVGTPLGGQLFGSGSVGQGVFRALWSDPLGQGTTLPDNAVLFKMYFKVTASLPGFYPVKIEPNNNPTSFEAVNIANKILPLANVAGGAQVGIPSDLKISALCVVAPPCSGNTATIIPVVSGGVPPYTYQWKSNNGLSAQDSTLINIPQGEYGLTVTDAAGSSVEAISKFLQYPSNLVIAAHNIQPATCNLSNGCANLVVNGGVPPYTFNWSQPGPSTQNRCDLFSGTVITSVTDAEGCLNIYSFQIGKDSLLEMDLDSVNADCRFDVLGAVNLTVNGQAPHSFQWSNGATTQNLSQIGPGIYSVTATDAIGCIAKKQIRVRDYGTFDWSLYFSEDCISTQWPQPITSSANLTLQSYDFASRAAFPLTLSWSTGTRQNLYTLDDDEFYKDLGTIEGLPSGKYAVTLTDAEGCSETRELTTTCNATPDYVNSDSPSFYIWDREYTANSLDSCVEVYGSDLQYLTKIDFAITWSNYYVKFKELRIKSPALKEEDFTLGFNTLDFNFHSDSLVYLQSYFTLFKVCFEPKNNSGNQEITFTSGNTTPGIVHATDGNLGFIGRNGTVNFNPSSSAPGIQEISLRRPTCETDGFARIELITDSWSVPNYQNLQMKYNNTTMTSPEHFLFAKPGVYNIKNPDAMVLNSLVAYVPPYSVTTDCVWPGDADHNRAVNHFDLLYMGLGLGSQSSAIRVESDTVWQGCDVLDWSEQTPNHQINFKSLDLDGNGTIEPADTATLIRHWSQTTNPYLRAQAYSLPYAPDAQNPLFKVDIQADTVLAGPEVKIPITFSANDIQGLAFSLSYDSVLVVSEAHFEPTSSWLGDPLQNLLSVQKDFQQQSRLDIAITRTDHNPVSGTGKIGDLILRFLALPADAVLPTALFTSHGLAITPTEERILLDETRKDLVLFGPTLSGTANPKSISNQILLAPNPTTDFLHIQSYSSPITRVEISSADGSQQKTSSFGSPMQQVQIGLEQLPAGTYFARVFCGNGVAVKKFVIGG